MTNQNIIGFQITMNYSIFMKKLDSFDKLSKQILSSFFRILSDSSNIIKHFYSIEIFHDQINNPRTFFLNQIFHGNDVFTSNFFQMVEFLYHSLDDFFIPCSYNFDCINFFRFLIDTLFDKSDSSLIKLPLLKFLILRIYLRT